MYFHIIAISRRRFSDEILDWWSILYNFFWRKSRKSKCHRTKIEHFESIKRFFKCPIPSLFFFIFVFSIQLTFNKCSIWQFANDWIWATTTAQLTVFEYIFALKYGYALYFWARPRQSLDNTFIYFYSLWKSIFPPKLYYNIDHSFQWKSRKSRFSTQP